MTGTHFTPGRGGSVGTSGRDAVLTQQVADHLATVSVAEADRLVGTADGLRDLAARMGGLTPHAPSLRRIAAREAEARGVSLTTGATCPLPMEAHHDDRL